MKKVIKIILIALLVLVVIGIGGCSILMSIINKANETYWEHSRPAGVIETKYTALGEHEVTFAEFDAENDIWQKYVICYPSDMKDGKTYPLIIIANGTGSKATGIKPFFKHLASWGFIVAGNEDENSRSGESSAATLDYMLAQNGDSNSVFYGKIDTDNIGIMGHSQGGVAAINAVTEQTNGNLYKAIWSASATSRYHAKEMNTDTDNSWSVDISKINVPIFMVAGTGNWDAGNMTEYTDTLAKGEAQGICPLWWLTECYSAIPGSTTKIIARMPNHDHGDIINAADGYMTAWFMYYLQNDTEAGKAFFGESAEILTNTNWQDVKTSK